EEELDWLQQTASLSVQLGGEAWAYYKGRGWIFLLHGRAKEALEAFEESDRLLRIRGFRADYSPGAGAWLVTALRKWAEALQPFAVAERAELYRRARKVAKRYLKLLRYFRNSLPHMLRELGILSALHGQARRARRYFDRSLALALEQGAAYEA